MFNLNIYNQHRHIKIVKCWVYDQVIDILYTCFHLEYIIDNLLLIDYSLCIVFGSARMTIYTYRCLIVDFSQNFLNPYILYICLHLHMSSNPKTPHMLSITLYCYRTYLYINTFHLYLPQHSNPQCHYKLYTSIHYYKLDIRQAYFHKVSMYRQLKWIYLVDMLCKFIRWSMCCNFMSIIGRFVIIDWSRFCFRIMRILLLVQIHLLEL